MEEEPKKKGLLGKLKDVAELKLEKSEKVIFLLLRYSSIVLFPPIPLRRRVLPSS